MNRNKCIAIILIVLAIIAILYNLSGRKELLDASLSTTTSSTNSTPRGTSNKQTARARIPDSPEIYKVLVNILTKIIINNTDCGVTDTNIKSKYINSSCITKFLDSRTSLKSKIANLLSQFILINYDDITVDKWVNAADNIYENTSSNPFSAPNSEISFTQTPSVVINKFNNFISYAVANNMTELGIYQRILGATESISTNTQDNFTVDNLINEIIMDKKSTFHTDFVKTYYFILDTLENLGYYYEDIATHVHHTQSTAPQSIATQRIVVTGVEAAIQCPVPPACPVCPVPPACPVCHDPEQKQEQEYKQEVINTNVAVIPTTDKIDVAKLNEKANKVDPQTKKDQACTIL